MATAKHKVSVSWREELVGDEKDSMSFYLRLTPRFKDKGEVFDVKAFLAEIKKEVQQRTNAKLKGKKIG